MKHTYEHTNVFGIEYEICIRSVITSSEAKHNNVSCYANLQLSRTIKTIVNLQHSMTYCYA